jgi:hypothetical protein
MLRKLTGWRTWCSSTTSGALVSQRFSTTGRSTTAQNCRPARSCSMRYSPASTCSVTGFRDRSSKAAAPRLSRGVARPRPFNPRHLGGTGATSKEVVPAADAAPACVAALNRRHHGLGVSQNCGTTPAVLPLSWETVQRLADFALGARFRRLPRFFRFKVQRSFATFDAGSQRIHQIKDVVGCGLCRGRDRLALFLFLQQLL